MKLKKIKSYFTCLLFFSISIVYAQAPVSLDKIKLKDGSELKGEILSQEDYLLLKLIDGQEVEIELDQIESIENKNPNKLFFPNGASILTRGWYHSGNIAFGGAGFSSEEGGTSTTIELINGYKFNEKIALGLGVGLNIHTFLMQGAGEFAYVFTDDQYSFVPFYLEARISPWQKKIAPYFTVNAGYGLGVDIFDYWSANGGSMKGGISAGASFGLHVSTKKKMGFLFHLNYKMQEASGRRNDLNGFYRITDVTFHRLLLGIGWSF